MQHDSPFVRQSINVLVAIGVAVLTVLTISFERRSGAQDVMRLETRLSQLEQRLYTIENNLRNLEQQYRISSGPSRGTSQEDIIRLRTEIQDLQRRLTDDECALAKLDERTLQRDPKKRSGVSANDPCRLQVDTPLRLPNRP